MRMRDEIVQPGKVGGRRGKCQGAGQYRDWIRVGGRAERLKGGRRKAEGRHSSDAGCGLSRTDVWRKRKRLVGLSHEQAWGT